MSMANINIQIAIKRILELKKEDIDFNFQEIVKILNKIIEWINSQ